MYTQMFTNHITLNNFPARAFLNKFCACGQTNETVQHVIHTRPLFDNPHDHIWPSAPTPPMDEVSTHISHALPQLLRLRLSMAKKCAAGSEKLSSGKRCVAGSAM
jgi:hypothetical protein